MARIGIITAPAIGHINPFIFLSKELLRRGHQVIFFNIEDLKEKITSENIEFNIIGKGIIPKGIMSGLQNQLGQLGGMAAMELWQKNNAKLIYVMCWGLPKAVQSENIDMLLVDQSDAAGGSVAEYLSIPYVTIAMGNNMHWEKGVPPVFTNWMYGDSPVLQKRNIAGIQGVAEAFKPISDVVNTFRKKWNLPSYEDYRDIFPVSPYAQIAQMPHFFDFKRVELPEHFHYVGPFKGKLNSEISFPYEKLNGKPIIFASLGTVVNLRPNIFFEIANACKDLDVQLVIAMGSSNIPREMESLPGNPLVLSYVPQFEILKKAILCVTHAGLNTVLDALGNGVPLIAIPISFDQPGTAARIKWHKLGEIVSLNNISAANHLKDTIHQVLTDPGYTQNAKSFQEKLNQMNGVEKASDIIEAVFNHKTLQHIN